MPTTNNTRPPVLAGSTRSLDWLRTPSPVSNGDTIGGSMRPLNA